MKKKAIKKKVEDKAKTEKQATPPAPETKEDDNAFDFGGLPQRDLKKNLGCG